VSWGISARGTGKLQNQSDVEVGVLLVGCGPPELPTGENCADEAANAGGQYGSKREIQRQIEARFRPGSAGVCRFRAGDVSPGLRGMRLLVPVLHQVDFAECRASGRAVRHHGPVDERQDPRQFDSSDRAEYFPGTGYDVQHDGMQRHLRVRMRRRAARYRDDCGDVSVQVFNSPNGALLHRRNVHLHRKLEFQERSFPAEPDLLSKEESHVGTIEEKAVG